MGTLLDVSSDGSKIKYKEEEGKILLITEHPDTKALEKMCAEVSADRGTTGKRGDMHHIMRIPQAVLTKICAETGLNFFDTNDSKLILAILKGPEYRKFRTYAGNI